MTVNDPDTIAEVEALCAQYEKALAENDLDALDGFFWRDPNTVRLGVGENLFGIEEIRTFRQGRSGGSPPREVLRVSVTSFGADFATAHVLFRRTGQDSIGRQSQSWVRFASGWRIVSAHVSIMQSFA
ncbi:MAG: oxalurate catabolism protein HpxZ [Novosphingobium sp.]